MTYEDLCGLGNECGLYLTVKAGSLKICEEICHSQIYDL